ncbi:MAG: hypothetical protein WA384_17725 [Rhodomicrobium sp.]
MPALDEAISSTLNTLSNYAGGGGRREYGYDLWAPAVARSWVISERVNERERDRAAREASGVFYEAAWELCRRGLLRPGVHTAQAQGIDDGGGYCLTAYGRQWLREADEGHFISMQPGALAAAFERYRARFGEGYHQRTQEAIMCRNVDVWLPACVMMGAAAESVLLAIATEKGGREQTIRTYEGRDGRRLLLNLVLGQAPDRLARPFRAGMELLKYWRDTAGHGQVAPISFAEADQSLRELLSLSQFASDNWNELTAN